MKTKKKRDGHLILLIMIFLCCQYVAAHMSGWLIEAGEWDITRIGELPGYFKSHPLDVTSFHVAAYALIYLIGFAVYTNLIFKPDIPKAEMKGKEHGSNDFMGPEELKEFREGRITADFPYSPDCTIPAQYSKKKGWWKRKHEKRKQE